VRVFVGPADLHFEVWFAGKKLEGSHEPVTIMWDANGVAQRPSSPIRRKSLETSPWTSPMASPIGSPRARVAELPVASE